MGKRLNVSAGIGQRQREGIGVDLQSRAPRAAGASETLPEIIDVNEHLTRDLARVRAKFSMDAPPGKPTLTRAWRSEVALEEYEAEFVDTVADCLGAGLSLQDALNCWDTGELVADVADETDVASADDEAPSPVLAPAPRRLTTGHRLFVR